MQAAGPVLSVILTVAPEVDELPPISIVFVFGALTTTYAPFGAKLICHVPLSCAALPLIVT